MLFFFLQRRLFFPWESGASLEINGFAFGRRWRNWSIHLGCDFWGKLSGNTQFFSLKTLEPGFNFIFELKHDVFGEEKFVDLLVAWLATSIIAGRVCLCQSLAEPCSATLKLLQTQPLTSLNRGFCLQTNTFCFEGTPIFNLRIIILGSKNADCN